MLLNDEQLARSSVVANCAMNRFRQLDGPNSYAKELGFHPLDWLRSRLANNARAPDARGQVSWLDLCCGSGRALIQAGQAADSQISITGVDLVDFFDPAPGVGSPHLICADITSWSPKHAFDLVTCVHGLHYVGDKLGMLTRMAGWLTPDGYLIADFDPAAIRQPDGRPAGRPLTTALREAGFTFNPRRHRITLEGGRVAPLPYTYLGADDQTGPNYTGQPAIHSYYEHHKR